MNLIQLRDAFVTQLASDPRLAGTSIYAHGGEFTLKELERYAVKAPCVVLAVLRVQTEYIADIPHAAVTFGAACVVKSTAGEQDKTLVLGLTDAVLRSLALHVIPDLTGARRSSGLVARSLYSSELNNKGIAMWSVGWVSEVDLQDDPQTLVPFLTADVKYDLAPPDGSIEAEDVIHIPT